MGAREEDLNTITAFSGLNNLGKETALPLGTLREADNVLLDRHGKLKTRPGYDAPVIACSNGHSLWAERETPFALYADGADLYAMHADESAQLLRSGLSPGLPLSYARINSAVVWSNGVERGQVGLVDLAVHDWACPTPGSQPRLAVVPEGSLHPGRIKVACTWVDALGRESGTGRSATATLTATGGLLIEDLPQPADPIAVPFVRVYASSGDDAVLYLATQLPAGLPSYTLLRAPEGRQCATQFLKPLPPGEHVAYFDGRQLVATGKVLRWSPGLRYGLTNPAHHYTRFHAKLDVLAPVADGTDAAGVFVCAGDTTYYMTGGDPKDWRQSIPIPHGAVPGSLYYAPAEAWGIQSKQLLPAWLGKHGLYVVGLPGGQVQTFNDDTVVTATGERGASIFLESDGLRAFLTTLRGPTPAAAQKLSIGDRAIARVYREDGRTLE